MQTEVIKIDRENMDLDALKRAGEILKRGGLVAFPTETVYGLGGDGLHEESSRKIYEAKGRPSDNPLIVHVADMEHLEKIVKKVPKAAYKLAEAFWPGPMTMILEKNDLVPYGTTGGLDTVAIRMPSDPIALELIRQGGGYIAAPSANTSGSSGLDSDVPGWRSGHYRTGIHYCGSDRRDSYDPSAWVYFIGYGTGRAWRSTDRQRSDRQ